MDRKVRRKWEKRAKSEVGVLLPDVDPAIGEHVLVTLYANPAATFTEIALGLIERAPAPEVAKEILDAMFELALCKTKGDLIWLEGSGQSILAGTRRLLDSEGVVFGNAKWPMKALIMGPPIRHVVRLSTGVREIWMVGDLEGVAVKQTEAIAIGNATVERFGGRVIEDRQGPEVMRQSFMEANHTKRAKLRAQALASLDRMTTTTQERDQALFSVEHQRMSLAESLPGSLEPGLELHHEDHEDHIFRVERRVNDSWVQIVAVDKTCPQIPGGAWYRRDGRPPADTWGMEDNYCGFTDYPTRAGRQHADVGEARAGDLESGSDSGGGAEHGDGGSDGGQRPDLREEGPDQGP